MSEIVPSILEKNFSEIKKKLEILRERAKCVQIDFCDGIYVPNSTWPFSAEASKGAAFLENNLDEHFYRIINEEEGMPYWQDFDFEFDLMVSDAVEHFDLYTKLGPKRMIFHLGAQKNLEGFRHFLEGLDMYVRDNLEIGLAFRPSDDLEVVKKFSNKVDFLQVMGSDNIGHQGEAFSEKALEDIKMLKKELPGIVISVDIGINLQDAEMIIKAGVDRLVVGSAIWKSGDPIGALEEFQNLV